MLIEKDLVQPEKVPKNTKLYAIPATRLAEEMGRKIVMNIISVGFFTATTGIVSHEAAHEAVATSVPPGTEQINLKAFETGYEYGKKLVEGKQKVAVK